MTLGKCGFCSLSIVLVIIRDTLCEPSVLKEKHLTVKEGSCVTIECTVDLPYGEFTWFWIKNPTWNGTATYFSGTIVASNTEGRLAKAELASRFEYTGVQRFSPSSKSCNLYIKNLQKADSGLYRFRLIGQHTNKYIYDPLNLTVTENPCQVNFANANSEVKEFEFVSLRCITSGTCDKNPEFTGLSKEVRPENHHGSTTVSFAVNWQNDGQVVTCQTHANKDECQARSVKLTVQYAPKNTTAVISSTNIKQGDTVSLQCTSRGHPNATFSWFQEGHTGVVATVGKWWINSIRPTQSGNYSCRAQNVHGTETSKMLTINVKYAPLSVNIKANKQTSVTEGDDITLTCTKTESNPEDVSYGWFKDNWIISSQKQNFLNLSNINRENSGSYKCEVENSVGKTLSKEHRINVQYTPTNTRVSKISGDQVKVNSPLTLTCHTEASPSPHSYTWVHSDGVESAQWTRKTTEDKVLSFERVAITDTGCYKCSATNIVATGDESIKQCIEVLYGPTEPVLSMVPMAREGSLVSIGCSVQSRPQSLLTLTWSSKSEPLASRRSQPLDTNRLQWENSLNMAFNVTPAQAGFYTCRATNSEGSSSAERKLDVTYSPRNMTAVAYPSTIMTENGQLMLTCLAQSNPAVSSYIWTRTSAGQTLTVGRVRILTIRALDPSHSGNYSCVATNEVGAGQSQEVDIKVKYAPKRVEILHNMTSILKRDWWGPVALSCRGHSYPPVQHFKWYRLMEDKEHFVTDRQNLTVQPHEPGTYYCVASNEISGKASDKVVLFLYKPFTMVHQILLSLLIVLVLLALIIYIYRRTKSAQQRPSNPLPSWGHLGFLAWRSGTREDLVSAAGWSDDLLPVARHDPEPQPGPACPDSTATSGIHTVYSALKMPTGNQSAAPRAPNRDRDGHIEDDAINYASLHFGDHKMTNQSATGGADDLYAKVAKPKPMAKNEQKKRHDYENVKGACAPKCPRTSNSDTESSEEDVELNYSKVFYKAKAEGQHRRRSSQSSVEEYNYHTQ